MPRTAPPPTLDQLFILIARAERKGGLNAAEGERLRAGLHRFAGHRADESLEIIDLRRKHGNLRKTALNWKRKALAAETGADTRRPAIDDHARDALRRVTALAQRWTHIPAKRQAGAAVLAAITNQDDE
jgi:hypothetical protein